MRGGWLGVTGLAVACATPAPDLGDGAIARVDADEGLFVLPPLGAGPAGDVVGAARPEVEVRRVGGGVLARYHRGSPTHPLVLRLTPGAPDDGDGDPAGFFHARLDVAALGLVAGDRASIRFRLDDREIGRTDLRVVGGGLAARAAAVGGRGVVAPDAVLPLRFRVDRGVLDGDGDGVADAVDACPDAWDPDQVDSVGDGVGDACRCAAVACAVEPGCDPGICQPETGVCAPGLCIDVAPAWLSGRVLGRSYGWLDDAAIVVRSGSEVVATTSGVDGAYGLAVPFAESELVVSRVGFADYVAPLSFGPAQSGVVDVSLTPVLAWLDVEVWRGVAEPWPGAVVVLSGAASASGVTDAAGKIRFDLIDPGVPIELSVDGVPANLPAPYVLDAGTNTVLLGMY